MRRHKASMTTTLAMPVLAIGGEKSFGATEALVIRNAATDVTADVIASSGHWLMEERPRDHCGDSHLPGRHTLKEATLCR